MNYGIAAASPALMLPKAYHVEIARANSRLFVYALVCIRVNYKPIIA